MIKPSQLDNDDVARIAWGRYRRAMRWMALISAALGLIGWALLPGDYRSDWLVSLIAIAGIALTAMLTGALMALVFLSSATGHDEAIEDPTAPDLDDNDNDNDNDNTGPSR